MEHRQPGLGKHAFVATALKGLGKLMSKNKMATAGTGLTGATVATADHSKNLANKSSKMFSAPRKLPTPVANTGRMKIN